MNSSSEAGIHNLSGVPGAEPLTKVEKFELEVRQLSEREIASFRAKFSAVLVRSKADTFALIAAQLDEREIGVSQVLDPPRHCR